MITKDFAIKSVLEERARQDLKWGQQSHSEEWWLAILMEEVGELSQAILETHFDNGTDLGGFENIRKEAVQVAAVAVAMLECIDRKPLNSIRYTPKQAVHPDGSISGTK